MSNSTWDYRFLELAKQVAQWSKDPSTKVGAVLVDADRRVVAVGYNGFPRGCVDRPELYADREQKYQRIVHAEVNAILHAESRAKGCTLYVWPTLGLPPVCNECAKLVIQVGIKEIVGFTTQTVRPEWQAKADISKEMLAQAGVKWRDIIP